MTPYERALLIANPVAGHGRALRLGQQLRESLESRGVVCSVRVTSGEGDANRWAEAAGSDGDDGGPFDLIVAIGGDGTVSEIVSGQARSDKKVPIAIVPVGTANVVAIALSLPWFPGMAAGNIQAGRIVPFDVGFLPQLDRHFLLMAAIGYPARVIQDSPRRLKNLFGFFAYVAAGIRNALKLDDASIIIEDENGKIHEFEGNTILLSNIGKIGDINFKVTPDTSAHDGLFDLTVISGRSLWGAIGVLFRMLTWRYKPSSRLHHFQARKVVITTDPPVPVQLDGEDLGLTPLEAEIISGGVHLIVGARYREKADEGGFLDEFNLPQMWPRKRG